MSFVLLLEGQRHEVRILARRPDLVLSVDGRAYRVEDPGGSGDGARRLAIAAQVQEVVRLVEGTALQVRAAGRTHHLSWLDGSELGDGGSGLSVLRAPMPGAVIEIHAAPGAVLTPGQPILTIESMKLQTVMRAPRAGILAAVAVGPGELFGKDEILARLAEEEADHA